MTKSTAIASSEYAIAFDQMSNLWRVSAAQAGRSPVQRRSLALPQVTRPRPCKMRCAADYTDGVRPPPRKRAAALLESSKVTYNFQREAIRYRAEGRTGSRRAIHARRSARRPAGPPRLYTACPEPRSAPVFGSALMSDAVRAAMACRTSTSAPETVTVTRPSPPPTAGWGSSINSQSPPEFHGPRASSPCDML